MPKRIPNREHVKERVASHVRAGKNLAEAARLEGLSKTTARLLAIEAGAWTPHPSGRFGQRKKKKGPRGRAVSADAARAVELAQQGWKDVTIARELGRNISSVKRWTSQAGLAPWRNRS